MTLRHSFILLISAALFLLYTAFIKKEKEFVGKITYSIQTNSLKKDAASQKKLADMFGTEMTLYIKNGDNLRQYNGNDISKVYYLKSSNKEYSQRKNHDSLFVLSCDTFSEKFLNYKRIDSTVMINQRPCKILILESEFSKKYHYKSTYYYDASLFINPTDYQNRKFGFVNMYYEFSRAQWLKYVLETKTYSVTYTATKIEKLRVNDSIFKLPNLPMAHW